MSNKRKIEFISPVRRNEEQEEKEIDWSKCFMCQKETKEMLLCSYKSKNQDPNHIQAIYSELAERLFTFKNEGVMPIDVNLTAWPRYEDLGIALYDNHASHHKSCKLLFSSSKFALAKKRKKNINPQESINDDKQEILRQPGGSRSGMQETSREVCFFCAEPANETYPLHLVHTFRLDQRVRKCVHLLNDSSLHAKLQQGDMIAQDAKYHRKCLIELYRKANIKQLEGHYTDSERQLHGIALSEVVSFIEQSRMNCREKIPVFKLSDLCKMYVEVIESHGVHVDGRIHSTRLKNRILAHFEELEEYKEGREVILAFKHDVGDAIATAESIDYDDEGFILAEAARIIRRDVFNHTQEQFNGYFEADCQQKSVPTSLQALVSMLLRGPTADHANNPYFTQAMLTLSQLLIFNTTKRTREQSSSSYHSQSREPPIAMYIGLMIHSQTRKLGIVDKLCHLGLSISSDRLLNVSTYLGNMAIEQFEKEKVVCPLELKRNLFTVAAVDNIDVNPTSSTAMSSFHGTAASLHQKVTIDGAGDARETPAILSKDRKLKRLPDNFTEVPPAYLPSEIRVPDTQHKPIEVTSAIGIYADNEWLETVRTQRRENLKDISWAAYHATNTNVQPVCRDISALLPMWRDSSKSPAMIKHALHVISKAIEFLNPGQSPVVTFDQPLYALAKRIQWQNMGKTEENGVIMLGPLHTEMAFLSALGDFLERSGWTTVIINAGVTRPGVAQSLLSGHDVARTKYAHQVTACCLNILIHEAYDQYIAQEPNDQSHFELWRNEMEMKNPMFQYWSLALKMELQLLLFIRSVRDKNFKLYILALENLLPWFFSFDHYNYARWLSVHLYDMKMLQQSNPEIHDAFSNKGGFVVSRTSNPFSSMGIDQCHEQLNKLVKGDGGAIGLTEDEEKLRKWMISGPEVARVVIEFEENSALKETKKSEYRHHEQTAAFQNRFCSDVDNLTVEFKKFGNPFSFNPEDNDLIQLDTRDIMGPQIAKTISEIEQIGKKQADLFMNERLIEKVKNIDVPIKKNKLLLFSSANTLSSQDSSKNEKKLLKNDRKLFAQLYIATQVRGGDVQELFTHETRKEPPSLSKGGEIRSGNKSDLLQCIKSDIDLPNTEPVTKAAVLEGSVLVNILKPEASKTFQDYADCVFATAVNKELNKSNRVDIVFDTYKTDSLKATTRRKRGKGIRRKVEKTSQPPKNWHSFLRIDENKSELFRFLSNALVDSNMMVDKLVLCAFDNTVVSNLQYDNKYIAPCSHEEADTRVFLHIKDISRQNMKSVKLKTVDTDVIVIALAMFPNLHLEELWIEFGTGKNKCYYPIHQLHQHIGREKCRALMFFHSFTGCDQVSYFNSIRKKSAWKTWNSFPEVTADFVKLSEEPSIEDVKSSFPSIERFTALMYKRTTTATTVDEARREMFVKDGRDLETIPPTSAALFQHTLRAAYVAGYVWNNSLVSSPDLPSPHQWGWIVAPDGYKPMWSKLPEASTVIRELIKCKCNPEKGCTGRCTCFKSDMPCTELCRCGGDCEHN